MPHEVHMESASRPDFGLEAIKVGRQQGFMPGAGLEKPAAVTRNIKVKFEK
jgi:hypothetical protein